MKASEELFNLIQSLSKSEKGYFKKNASLHVIGNENRYEKLFDTIEKQKVYNEQKAIEALGFENQIQNFAVLKSYLYNLILKTLRNYHSQSTPSLDIKEILGYIEILHEKGLYKQCNKLISKGISIAEKYELLSSINELITWKIELLPYQNYPDNSPEETEKIFKELFDCINKNERIAKYRHLLSLFFSVNTSPGFIRKKEDSDFHDTLSKHELLTNPKLANSFQATWHYYLWRSLYAFSKYEYEQSYAFSKELLDLMEKNHWQKDLKPKAYISALNNLLVMQLETGRYHEINDTLTKFKAITPKSDNSKRWLYFVINSSELNLYMVTGEFEKGVLLADEIENTFYKNNKEISFTENEITLIFNMALTYFGAEKYSRAIYYLNKIINESQANVRTDVHCFARIVSLIVHYELGNNDLLEYTIRSTYRFLYTRKRLYKFETLILQFMRKHMGSRHTDEKKLMAGFKKLIEEIEELKSNPFEKKALHYFDFISWLKSKVQKRKFAQIVREYSGQKLKPKIADSK